LSLPVEIRSLSLTDAYSADEMFLCGTAMEVTPIKEVDRRVIGDGTPGPITRRIQQTFFDAVHGRLPQYRSWLAPVRSVAVPVSS
jgi:branched-chain amino acid aminotransferase